jgi:hypothetical protein
MTVNEIVDELRATRPRASEPLRLEVLTVTSRPPRVEPSLVWRLRRKRLVLLVPAAAGLAVASAIAIGVTRPEPALREAAAPRATTDQQLAGRSASESAPTTSTGAFAGAQEDATTALKSAPPGTVAGRAQRYSASLTLGVEDTDALSEATQRALSIARDLGGFVVAVRYATGDEGVASVTLRVPSGRAGDAVTRLSALGTILAQNVQIDDLQESIDGYDRELQRLEAQLATVKAQLAGTLTEAERARLEERRAQLKAQLDQYRASRAATAAEARLATFQLELRTEKREGAPVPGSRLDRALDKALAVLTWEAVVALAFAVAVAPLVLLGVVLWGGRRMHRRRDEDRLLAAS